MLFRVLLWLISRFWLLRVNETFDVVERCSHSLTGAPARDSITASVSTLIFADATALVAAELTRVPLHAASCAMGIAVLTEIEAATF